jgi:hypothetical protein
LKTNNTYLKVGDKITCHTVCRVEDKEDTTTIGKTYTIVSMNYDDDNRFSIIDDNNRHHYFYGRIGKKHSYYEKWFYSALKRERKEKLKKILKLNE